MRELWHRCDNCYWYGEAWCDYEPGGESTLPDRKCSRWECQGCGGSYDDDEDHSDCMVIEVELE